MMRLLMYSSGIAIVAMAAIAAASSLSGVVVGEESSAAIFSSRFLNSLDSASAAAGVGDFATTTTTTTNSNGPLSMVGNEITEENAYSSRGDGDDINSSHHQRRELSWWSIALQFGEFCCCLFLPSLAFREGVFSSSSSSSLGAYYTHTFNRLYTSSS